MLLRQQINMRLQGLGESLQSVFVRCDNINASTRHQITCDALKARMTSTSSPASSHVLNFQGLARSPTQSVLRFPRRRKTHRNQFTGPQNQPSHLSYELDLYSTTEVHQEDHFAALATLRSMDEYEQLRRKLILRKDNHDKLLNNLFLV